MIDGETIRVVIFQDGDKWVAQCLEYDIGAQADDTDKLRNVLTAVLSAECEESRRRHGKPFAGIERAPDHFFEMWEKRSRTFEGADRYPPNSGVNLDLALVA